MLLEWREQASTDIAFRRCVDDRRESDENDNGASDGHGVTNDECRVKSGRRTCTCTKRRRPRARASRCFIFERVIALLVLLYQ